MDDLSPDIKKALDQQKANCIFCKIVSGEVQGKKVIEDDLILAILDISPARPGHILLMPKEHYPIMPLMPKKSQDRLFEMARLLCVAQKKAMVTHGSSVFIANGFPAGQQSQHFMVHLMPRDPDDGLPLDRLEGNGIDPALVKETVAVLSNNISLLVEKKLAADPKEWHAPKKTEGHMVLGREKVLQVIEQNPRLKDLIVGHPLEFLKECSSNPELVSLFRAVDPESIVEHYLPGELKRREEGKKGGLEKEHHEEDEPDISDEDSSDVSLDDISRLLK